MTSHPKIAPSIKLIFKRLAVWLIFKPYLDIKSGENGTFGFLKAYNM